MDTNNRGHRDGVLIVAGVTAAAATVGLAAVQRWIEAGLCAALSLFWLVAGLIRPRLRTPVPHPPRQVIPICQVCGYDLRATPHRCPECGTLAR